MVSRSDALVLLMVAAIWIGALVLAMILLYARREYGPKKNRTIGAILIDTSLSFSALIVGLGALSALRPLGFLLAGVALTLVRYGTVVLYLLVIWVAVVRLIVWTWRGDEGQSFHPEKPLDQQDALSLDEFDARVSPSSEVPK